MMDADGAEMYQKYIDEMTRFAASLSGPFVAAEIASDAAVRALSGGRWREASDVRAYLFRSVLNEARSNVRANDRRLRRETEYCRRQELRRSADVSVETLELLVKLTVRQRAVIYLTYWEDLDGEAVAAALGLSRRTVERELSVARQRLKKGLA
jgi:RNA polymerase sigma-70 factor (ECF subfamily)